jgi:hypothetical protein
MQSVKWMPLLTEAKNDGHQSSILAFGVHTPTLA